MPVTPGSATKLNHTSGIASAISLTAEDLQNSSLMGRVLPKGFFINFPDGQIAITDGATAIGSLSKSVDKLLIGVEKDALVKTFSGVDKTYKATSGGFLVLGTDAKIDPISLPTAVYDTATGKIKLDALPDSVRAGVSTIADYAGLSTVSEEQKKGLILVLDASADASVDKGAAMYQWVSDKNTFLKIAEVESLDIDVAALRPNYQNIQAAGAIMYDHPVIMEPPTLTELFELMTASLENPGQPIETASYMAMLGSGGQFIFRIENESQVVAYWNTNGGAQATFIEGNRAAFKLVLGPSADGMHYFYSSGQGAVSGDKITWTEIGDATVSTATLEKHGIVKPDGSTITIDNGVLTAVVPKITVATNSTPGIVQPDGSSITIDANGKLTSKGASLATSAQPGLVRPDGVSTVVDGTGMLKAVFGGNGGDPNTPPTKIKVTTNGQWVPPKNGWVKIGLQAPGGGGCGGTGNLQSAMGGGGGGQGELVEFYQYLNTTDVITISLGAAGAGSDAALSSTTSNLATWTPGGDATDASITINGTTTTAIGGKGAGKSGLMLTCGLGGNAGNSPTAGSNGEPGQINTVDSGASAGSTGGKGGGPNSGHATIADGIWSQIDAVGYGSGGTGGRGSSYSAATPTRGSNGGPGLCTVEYLSINASSASTGFSANKSAIQVVPSAATATWYVVTPITFDTVEWNINSQYSAADSKFTPGPGTWLINASVTLYPTTAGNAYHLYIYKNGVACKRVIIPASATTNYTTASVSALVTANGTDYFEVKMIGTDSNGSYRAGAYSIQADHGTFFNAIQIQAPSGGSVATTSTIGLVKPDGTSITIDANGKISASSAASGALLTRSVYETQAATASGTTKIPWDSTIPQNTEGDQYMSVSITPKSATSKLQIDVCFVCSCATAAHVILALFMNTNVNAIAASFMYIDTDTGTAVMTLRRTIDSPGKDTPVTFKVRAGSHTGTRVSMNSSNGANFGSVLTSSVIVSEFAA